MTGFFTTRQLGGSGVPADPVLPQCGLCKLHTKCTSPKMKPTGKGKRKILFVAEAPGETEDKEGVQLIGDAGQCLRRALYDHANLDLDQCWKTNAVVCRPPKNKIENYMISCCRPNLMRDIQKLAPNVIVVLGASALQSLLYGVWKKDIGPLGRWVGWTIPSEKYNAWICPTYHPSYVLRMREDPALVSIWGEHMQRAIALEKTPVAFKPVDKLESQVECIHSPRLIRLRLRDLAQKRGCLAFDYETTGLKPDRKVQRIVSCSFCYKGHDTFAFPVSDGITKDLVAVLRAPKLKKIASNLKFEERWTLAKFGVGVANWHWDTMLAAHVLDNRPGISSIKFQAFVLYGIPDYDSNVSEYLKASSPNQLNKIDSLDVNDLLVYNGMDSLLEYKVAMNQKKRLLALSKKPEAISFSL